MFSSLFRRALAGLGFSILLGGCKSRPAPPIATAPRPSRPAPTSTPRATPKPLPAWRKKPHVVYGVQTKRRVLALTFDDGPDPTWTPKVLAILQQTRTPATFFMVGKMVRAHPQFAQMVKDGHFPIGNHSWSHPSRPRNPRSEVELTDAILGKILKIKPTLFRPPYGIMKNGLAPVALSRGEDVINWNSLGADWDKHQTSASIEANVLRGACSGGITLLHDGGGNRSKTVAALPRIIARLRARGYSFVTVPQLLLMGPPVHVRTSTKPRRKKPRQHRSGPHSTGAKTALHAPHKTQGISSAQRRNSISIPRLRATTKPAPKPLRKAAPKPAIRSNTNPKVQSAPKPKRATPSR